MFKSPQNNHTYFTKNTLYRHLIIWLGLILFTVFNNFVTGSIFSKTVYVFFFLLNFAISYYLLFLFILPKFYSKPLYLFTGIAFTLLLFVSLDLLHLKYILPHCNGSTPRGSLKIMVFFYRSAYLFTYVIITSIGSYLNQRAVFVFRELKEKEKLGISSQINFLKNQFHSHLTFNFLNNCYSNLIKKSPHAAESIIAFSEVLRFNLKTKPNELIQIKEEIYYLENFLTIQKCLNPHSKIHFIQEIDKDVTQCVFPALLNGFIENLIKLGVKERSGIPLVLQFCSTKNEVSVVLKIYRKHNTLKTENTPLFESLKNSLEQFYKNKLNISVIQNKQFQETQITLSLNNFHAN